MQRVAIARALINNPDILLADEPTGALDSETSIQVMNLLKKISKDKLVIMVTHNPDLAHQYSNRIISLKDGEVTSDTNPYDGSEEYEVLEKKSSKKTSMSFLTALSLSLNNLMTKKGRTLLTSFAGSIGIIGIALILSLSNGVNNYINRVQEDTLTSYPLSIEKQSVDPSTLMASFMGGSKAEHDNDAIYSNDIMTSMISATYGGINTNNLVDFKKFIENNDELKSYVNDIKYTYNLNLQIYAEDSSLKVNPSNMMSAFGYNSESAMSPTIPIFNELTENDKLLRSQYDLVSGRYPTKYDELVLIVDENNEINDFILYSLGIKDQKEIAEIMQAMSNGQPIKEFEQTKYTYEDILNMKFRLL